MYVSHLILLGITIKQKENSLNVMIIFLLTGNWLQTSNKESDPGHIAG